MWQCLSVCLSVCWSQQYWSEWSVSKVDLGFRNFGYDFWGVGGDVWRWWGDERTVQRAQTVSEDPHRPEQKSFTVSNAFGWRGHVMKVYKYDSTLSRKVQGLNNMQHILKSFNQKCNWCLVSPSSEKDWPHHSKHILWLPHMVKYKSIKQLSNKHKMTLKT